MDVKQRQGETRSLRDTVEVWFTGIHNGTAFGAPREIAVGLVGVVPLVLAWTGTRMWLRRQRMGCEWPT